MMTFLMTGKRAAITGALMAALAGMPALANQPGETAKSHGHDHQHDHAHAHDHADEDAARKAIGKGYFEDSQIAPRSLVDWQGEWQSVYPLLMAGKLDAVMTHKAAHGDKTAAEYLDYYKTGYRTDVEGITIAGDMVTFWRDGKAVSARYADDGHEILTYKKGNRGVRYIFRKTEGDAEAPQFIQFSDHRIAPEAADHYHLYWGNDRAQVLAELTNWPTYYPAALTPEEIAVEMMAH